MGIERVSGQCHCGAIRYSMPVEVKHHALCHCQDCRRHAGAPAVAWGLIAESDLQVDGTPQIYASSEHGRRHFCSECGTGLFYTNKEIFPDQIDVQTATLDQPASIPLQEQIQLAERISWMANLDALPAHQRYPGME